jgi:hypothetical protein
MINLLNSFLPVRCSAVPKIDEMSPQSETLRLCVLELL